VVWAVAGIAAAYLPFPFQRKLIMGEAVPMGLLAGYGAAYIARTKFSRHYRMAAALLCLAALPSTLLFLIRDCVTLTRSMGVDKGTLSDAYLNHDELYALRWISRNAKPNESILAAPRLAIFIPGYADRATWAAHWGETPNNVERVMRFAKAFLKDTTIEDRRRFILSTHTQWLCYPNDPSHPSLKESLVYMKPAAFCSPAEMSYRFLIPKYANSEYTIYRIEAR
jgi:hypothetical protein